MAIAFSVAFPQALIYMRGNLNLQRPIYGLITNGDEFQFIKLLIQDNPQYDLSNIFSLLLPRRNQIYDIMRVLKQMMCRNYRVKTLDHEGGTENSQGEVQGQIPN